MAIDYTGITSIDAGAPDIKYTGDEGPKSPQEEMQIAGREYNRVLELLEKVRENMPLSEEEKMELQGLIKTLTAKGIPVEQLIGEEQGREGIQMASAADPMLEEQAVAGMATGGRVGFRYGYGASQEHYEKAQEKQAAANRESRRTSQYDSAPKPKPQQTYSPHTDHGGSGVGEGPAEPAYVMSGGKKHYQGSPIYNQEIKKSQDIVKEHQEKKPPIIKTVWDHLTKQKTSNARRYVAYLRSRNINIPDWLREIYEGDAKYLTEEQEKLLNYGWDPNDVYGPTTTTFVPGMKGVGDPTSVSLGGGDPRKFSPITMDYKDWKASGMDSRSGEIGNFNLLARGDLGNLKDLPNPGTVVNPKTGMPFTDFEWDQHKRRSGQGASSYDRGPSEPLPLWQRLGYGSEQEYRDAGGGPYLPVTPDPDPDPTPAPPGTTTADPFQVASFSEADLDRIYGTSIPTTGTLGWTRPSPNILQHQFVADGGRIGYAGGGIADLRQGYFLGKLVKSITKPFKGITKGIKKFAKSPAGKLALMAALGGHGSGMFGSGTGSSWLKNIGTKLIGSPAVTGYDKPGHGLLKSGSTGWLGKLLLSDPSKAWSMANVSPWKAIGGLSALGGLYTAATDDDDENELYKKWLADKAAADAYWIPRFEDAFADGGRIGYAGAGLAGLAGLDPRGIAANETEWITQKPEWKIVKRDLNNIFQEAGGLEGDGMNAVWKYVTDNDLNYEWMLQGDEIKVKEKEKRAQGGRIGYAGGGYNDDDEEDHRSAALSAMYGLRKNAQEGGLMDMGGMEKDYRNEGGFVPIGGQERADDVPARLSKNEFVFTADAVRNAGGGDIDKGAEIMENLMENLEQGGKVSEESQGLEGARDMFATSQRLEGVL